MKRFIRSAGGKVILFILSVVSLLGSVAGVTGTAVSMTLDVYSMDKAELREQLWHDMVYSDSWGIGYQACRHDSDEYKDSEFCNLRYKIQYPDGSTVYQRSTENDDDWQYRVCFYAEEDMYGNFEGVNIYRMESYEGDTVYYNVYGAPSDKTYTLLVSVDTSIGAHDRYMFVGKAADALYTYRNAFIPMTAAFLILGIASFAALMCAAGRRTQPVGEEEKLYPGVFFKVPYDIMLAAAAAVISLGILCIAELGSSFYSLLNAGSVVLICGIALIIANILVGLALSAAVRLKAGKLLSNTLIAIVLRLIWRCIKKIGRGLKRICIAAADILRSLPLVWKTAVMTCGVSLVEFIFIFACWWEPDVLITWWFIEKLIIVPLIIWAAVMLRRLQKTGEALASGDFDYKAATKGTFWDFRKHAENLNRISEGMTLAVDERMKSERMKTELITNVSHDIKTPLTSIINYAELIGQEQCDNERIGEYAAVLVRQSDRLKRLIEDLVEASKAATGNLEVMPVLCDANMFITQAAGEYEQKLSDAGLSIVTSQPEGPVYVMADGRRMLRVFDNLMNNICKYAQSGTRVYLSLETVGSQIYITFKNTSRDPLNISADELMERFVRGDSARNTDGNGLGLSIAKSLTELQGGNMKITIDGDLFKVILNFPTAEAGQNGLIKQ